jgi:hypothetical protein
VTEKIYALGIFYLINFRKKEHRIPYDFGAGPYKSKVSEAEPDVPVHYS